MAEREMFAIAREPQETEMHARNSEIASLLIKAKTLFEKIEVKYPQGQPRNHEERRDMNLAVTEARLTRVRARLLATS